MLRTAAGLRVGAARVCAPHAVQTLARVPCLLSIQRHAGVRSHSCAPRAVAANGRSRSSVQQVSAADASSLLLVLRPSRALLHGGRHHHHEHEHEHDGPEHDEDAEHGDAHAGGSTATGALAPTKLGRAMNKKQMERECTSITMYGLYSNVLLALFKFAGGIAGNSMAMIADAVHSLSDLVTDGITLWAARLTHKPQDAGHPYGHGKFEAIGSLSISVTLAGTAAGIAWSAVESIQTILAGQSLAVPTGIALVAAVVSIAVKEFLFHATMRVGNRWNSKVVKANAWHHRSDSISTLVAMVGVIGAMIKVPILDPIAGLLVSGLIMKAAVELGWDSLRDLSDENVDERVLRAVSGVLVGMKSEGVLGFHRLRGRSMGPFLLMDVHISVDPTISVSAAHQISERARIRVRQRMPMISEFNVHVELGAVGERTVFEDVEDDSDSDDRAQVRAKGPQLITGEHIAMVMREYDDAVQAHKQAVALALAPSPVGSSEAASAASHAQAASSTHAPSAASSSSFSSTLASIVDHTSGKDAAVGGDSFGEEKDPRAHEHDGPHSNLDLSRLMRPQAQIERDVRRVLSDPHSSFAPHLLGVSHFTVHWLDAKLTIQLELAFQSELTIGQAQALAHDVETSIRAQVPDVHQVDVHLELTPEHIHKTRRASNKLHHDHPHQHQKAAAASVNT